MLLLNSPLCLSVLIPQPLFEYLNYCYLHSTTIWHYIYRHYHVTIRSCWRPRLYRQRNRLRRRAASLYHLLDSIDCCHNDCSTLSAAARSPLLCCDRSSRLIRWFSCPCYRHPDSWCCCCCYSGACGGSKRCCCCSDDRRCRTEARAVWSMVRAAMCRSVWLRPSWSNSDGFRRPESLIALSMSSLPFQLRLLAVEMRGLKHINYLKLLQTNKIASSN